MPKLGRMNTLEVVKEVDFGVYLNGGEDFGEVLMPKRYVTTPLKAGDSVEVFLYLDSEDRIIATTETPKAMVGQCAGLEVVAVNDVGAFLDWGLAKDLLLPYGEQINPVEVGDKIVVCVYIDDASHRIAASARLDDFLHETTTELKKRQPVDLLIVGPTPLGYKAIVNGIYIGVLYRNEVSQRLKIGQQLKGYVKDLREDQKIDLSLNLLDEKGRDDLAERILAHLRDNGGQSPLTDKSSPEAIHKAFSVSKGNFKKSIGGLYRRKLITIEKDGIRLVNA